MISSINTSFRFTGADNRDGKYKFNIEYSR